MIEFIRELNLDLIGKICSFMDDTTIYNLLQTNKEMKNIITKAKDNILQLREYEPKYDDYSSIVTSNKNSLKYEYNHEYDDIKLMNYIRTNEVEDVHRFATRNETTSLIMLTPESNETHERSDIISSIKVKGDIRDLKLEFASQTIISKGFDAILKLNILEKDEEGFIEIMQPFVRCLPLFVIQFFDAHIWLQTCGLIVLKVTKCSISPQYMINNSWLNVPCRIPITTAKWYYRLLHYDKQVSNVINIKCIEKSIGIHIVIWNDNKLICNRNKVRLFQLDISNKNQIMISARKLHTSKMCQSKIYNLRTKLRWGYYIPLDALEIQPSDTIDLRVVFKQKMEHKFNIDVIYWYEDIYRFYKTGLVEDIEIASI
jgi:hypothetical protein